MQHDKLPEILIIPSKMKLVTANSSKRRIIIRHKGGMAGGILKCPTYRFAKSWSMVLTPGSELNIQSLSCCSLHQKGEWSGIHRENDELTSCVL